MIVPVLLLLIAAEVGLQWQEHSRINARIDKGDSFWKASATIHKKSDDHILIYELRPGAQSNREGVSIKINRNGFRDDPFPRAYRSKERRIVVLGDSVAWGWGVSMSSAFPQRLEKMLLHSDTPSTIYNLAVDGYSTEQELRMLELHGLTLKPDLIILNYVLNDPDTADGGLARYYKPDFMLLRLARRAVHRIQGILQGHADIKEYHQQIHSYYEKQTRNQFQRLGQISKKNHIPILVAITPVFHFMKDQPYPWQNIHNDLKQLCIKNNLKFLDLKQGFINKNSSDFALDQWHPNKSGHEIIAQTLAAYLSTHR